MRNVVALVGRGSRVAVLGGDVAGLTAAMELAERGFEVTVVEPAGWGGKARSAWVPGTGRGGRLDLPSEHGFRFLPGIYRSLPDTLRRIPVDGSTEGRVAPTAASAASRLRTICAAWAPWSPGPTGRPRSSQETCPERCTSRLPSTVTI